MRGAGVSEDSRAAAEGKAAATRKKRGEVALQRASLAPHAHVAGGGRRGQHTFGLLRSSCHNDPAEKRCKSTCRLLFYHK